MVTFLPLAKNLFSPFPKRKNVVTIYPHRNSLLLRLHVLYYVLCQSIMITEYQRCVVMSVDHGIIFKCVGITSACSSSAASVCTCAPSVLHANLECSFLLSCHVLNK